MRKTPWLSHLLSVLALWLASASAMDIKKALDDTGRAVGKEFLAAKHPIDETLTFIGNSQCGNVKKIIGVVYEPVSGAVEPDLNELNIQFRSSQISVKFNLSVAAELIPAIPQYNPRNNMILYMHGFTDNPMKSNFGELSEAFLAKGEYNIGGLDSSSLIAWFYLRATVFVRFIGNRVGEVLAALVKKGQDPKTIHLIGHSLGAHIAGFAGKTFQNLTGFNVGRISGLDPAGPCFADIPVELRLSKTDADFVDVIHSDNGVFGLDEKVGHVDFYPNFGSHQPGCTTQSCSHGRVNELYAESVITPDAFPAIACSSDDDFREGRCSDDDVKLMGYSCSPSTRGSYYLQTDEKSPYALGKEGLRYKNKEGVVRNIQLGISKGFENVFG